MELCKNKIVNCKWPNSWIAINRQKKRRTKIADPAVAGEIKQNQFQNSNKFHIRPQNIIECEFVIGSHCVKNWVGLGFKCSKRLKLQNLKLQQWDAFVAGLADCSIQDWLIGWDRRIRLDLREFRIWICYCKRETWMNHAAISMKSKGKRKKYTGAHASNLTQNQKCKRK